MRKTLLHVPGDGQLGGSLTSHSGLCIVRQDTQAAGLALPGCLRWEEKNYFVPALVLVEVDADADTSAWSSLAWPSAVTVDD